MCFFYSFHPAGLHHSRKPSGTLPVSQCHLWAPIEVSGEENASEAQFPLTTTRVPCVSLQSIFDLETFLESVAETFLPSSKRGLASSYFLFRGGSYLIFKALSSLRFQTHGLPYDLSFLMSSRKIVTFIEYMFFLGGMLETMCFSASIYSAETRNLRVIFLSLACWCHSSRMYWILTD